jgi:hypothetical protein
MLSVVTSPAPSQAERGEGPPAETPRLATTSTLLREYTELGHRRQVARVPASSLAFSPDKVYARFYEGV